VDKISKDDLDASYYIVQSSFSVSICMVSIVRLSPLLGFWSYIYVTDVHTFEKWPFKSAAKQKFSFATVAVVSLTR